MSLETAAAAASDFPPPMSYTRSANPPPHKADSLSPQTLPGEGESHLREQISSDVPIPRFIRGSSAHSLSESLSHLKLKKRKSVVVMSLVDNRGHILQLLFERRVFRQEAVIMNLQTQHSTEHNNQGRPFFPGAKDTDQCTAVSLCVCVLFSQNTAIQSKKGVQGGGESLRP